MKKAYLVPLAPVGYGPRIFIPYAHHTPEVEKRLKALCIWGAHDKDTGKCYGYEFPNPEDGKSPWDTQGEHSKRFDAAKITLMSLGFTFEDQGWENKDEIWA